MVDMNFTLLIKKAKRQGIETVQLERNLITVQLRVPTSHCTSVTDTSTRRFSYFQPTTCRYIRLFSNSEPQPKS